MAKPVSTSSATHAHTHGKKTLEDAGPQAQALRRLEHFGSRWAHTDIGEKHSAYPHNGGQHVQ
jgi:hypothetical protein